MGVFTEVTDNYLADSIDGARSDLVLVVPALSKIVGESLKKATQRIASSKVVLIVDSDEDAYRVGYGDPEGADALKELQNTVAITIREQPGLRIGLLMIDGKLLLWSPTPPLSP